MQVIHGGDIYRNDVTMDFSVNTNPLGMPETVRQAIYEAVEHCGQYPDITGEGLKHAIASKLSVNEEYLLLGNGASELFMAVVHGLQPRRAVIPVPSFFGYEYAMNAVEGEVLYYPTAEENHFCLAEDFFSVLKEEVDIVFLANPNNPVGNLMEKEYVRHLLWECMRRKIVVVLDECFVEFCGKEYSMAEEIEAFPNLLVIGAYTKSCSIPGVRLGYLLSASRSLRTKIKKQLPEWNLSTFAQAAGRQCAGQTEFFRKTAEYVRMERKFLEEGLIREGIRVYPGEANFLLVFSKYPLYELLLSKGILIRDCENFRGLGRGFYRIAVKSRKENEALLKAIGEITWKEAMK